MSRSEQKENAPIKLDKYLENNNEHESKRDSRLEYLLKRAELFSHFVTNGTKAKNAGKKGHRNKESAEIKPKRLKKEDGSFELPVSDRDEVKLMQYDKTPDYIDGEMRDYQINGLNWLIKLCENGINGILGDEMGLGKTIQTISIFGYMKNVKKVDGPFLVIAPLSTLQNWLNEAQRFCPSLRAFVLHAYKKDRPKLLKRLKEPEDWDLCITSYDIALKEYHKFRKPKWQYVVLDEGHKIKNEKSKMNEALHAIKSNHRLMLTGTPLQNNLHELWALLNYLLPDVFSSSADFDTWFDADDCLSGNQTTVNRIHVILKPFMLRRIKSEVELSLLPKKEMKLYVDLAPLQRDTYKKVLLKEIKVIKGNGEVTYAKINQILMELRKAANHPYLINGIESGPPYTTDQHLVDSCGKMKVLDQLLAQLKAKGSRVVLFSQFKIMLDIIEDYLVWKGYTFRRLDGDKQIEQRTADISDFNAENSDVFIFIITTRAGGLGINLTTADTVIIYDSDWNPQVDFQAIDRVHRIGQKKQVHVFRLITEFTVDQRIVQRAEIKERLDRLVIKSSRKASIKNEGENHKDVLLDVIRFGADEMLSDNKSDVNFDLKRIMADAKSKEDAEKARLDGMTLEQSSSTSVYQFEGFDFRAKQPVAAPSSTATVSETKVLPSKSNI
ncbi:chromatin-remodeling complex ATPase chain Iswi-like [Sitodiplosis mosellana]|uniref:chromatin-remodeling complex ATPase chain Iswi-like n=1 Tax=Sitodiplosis mosellana TaxID=263140 RepID=UPI002443C533|nr:chromatin-remodeling complex ATPase chain Iswi-like [Sitodiplosis mosellana]